MSSPNSRESSAPLAKRPRGRPKGSKNGPNAGKVGRPRKDAKKATSGQSALQAGVPKAQTARRAEQEPTPNTHDPASRSSQHAEPTPPSLSRADSEHSRKSRSRSLPATPNTSGGGADDSSSSSVSDATRLGSDPRDLGDEITILERHAPLKQKETEGHYSNSAADKNTYWAPPRGLGLGSECKGGGFSIDAALPDDDDEDVDYLFGDTPATAIEGSGDEFGPIPDDDEVVDPPQETPRAHAHSSGTPPNTGKSRQERSSMPTWLRQDYADTRERLAAEMKKNTSNRPTCYDRGTFIDGVPFAFFTAGRKAQPQPEDFYRPCYFVWLPHVIIKRIPCPACLKAGRRTEKEEPVVLIAKGWINAPRRVVDLERCLFIIGYRYLCPDSACKKSYQSWSPAILAALPRTLSIHFTHHLTYRGGLTDRVVSLMRSSFQHGIGPGPFAEMIRTHHIRHYELLHLHYMETVNIRLRSDMVALYARFKPFGLFDDRDGYAGFSPTPNYFRDFYVNYISSHSAEMDQHMAMLSADILQIDHSYKVIKHLGKVSGETVFAGGLHTGINEMVEIRSMTLTPTKAHAQYMPAINAINESLALYGHKQISSIYTDIPRLDKPELESALPSLRHNVVPVPDISCLPKIAVPSEWNVTILVSAYQVNTRLNCILDSLRDGEDLFVAMDMEWSVDVTSGIQGRVALVSIAFEGDIFLLPLHNHWHEGHLPSALLTFLRSRHVRKVGVKVSADLARLFKDCGFTERDAPFIGAINLGSFAKERNATPKATVSLADLTSTVLRQFLPKDPAIRVSTAWDNKDLSDAQVTYAALDAYATWLVFRSLTSVSVGKPVDDTTAGGTLVSLYSIDQSIVVAHGHVTPDRPKKHLGVSVSKTRVLVTITSILVPAHVVCGDLLPEPHNDTPFTKFPEPPFTLLCKSKHLQTRQPPIIPGSENHFQLPKARAQPTVSTLPAVFSNLDHSASPCTSEDNVLMTEQPISDSADSEAGRWYGAANQPAEDEQNPATSTQDDSGIKSANRLAALTRSLSTSIFSATIRSRVLGDIWHLMNQFPISTQHGLRRPFARALRDAFFLYDPEDQAVIEAFLAGKGVRWENMLLYHAEWLFQRVKRYVPAPEELLPRVSKVLHDFGPLKDALTGLPLFNDKAWEIAANALENVRRGYYSDPPGVTLYYPRNRDKYGLLRYRCCRGTNAIEGGIHQNIIRWFGAFNAAPDFALELLRDYALYHNLKVGTLNRTGTRYSGSFDIWTRNRISHLLDATYDNFTSLPLNFGPGGWVNGDNFARSSEVFGILPLSDQFRKNLGMLVYHPEFALETKIRHEYLAKRQNTRMAVLPIHTREERAIFKLLLTDPQGLFAGKKEPNWIQLAERWSAHSDGVSVFYKLPEHLRSYWKKWQENINEKNSITINQAAYDKIVEVLAPATRSTPAVPVKAGLPLAVRQQIDLSRELPSEEVTSWQVSILLGQHALQRSAVQYHYGERPHPSQLDKGKKRAFLDDDDRPIVVASKRKARSCPRCHRTDCDGAYRSRPCSAPKKRRK